MPTVHEFPPLTLCSDCQALFTPPVDHVLRPDILDDNSSDESEYSANSDDNPSVSVRRRAGRTEAGRGAALRRRSRHLWLRSIDSRRQRDSRRSSSEDGDTEEEEGDDQAEGPEIYDHAIFGGDGFDFGKLRRDIENSCNADCPICQWIIEQDSLCDPNRNEHADGDEMVGRTEEDFRNGWRPEWWPPGGRGAEFPAGVR
ncbi:hypothetical protein B0H63DRAFT_156685 [Podospora didyma]|uniref:Uncharacterized protein n=1 Tax=Podospora didyma TaxID=330526 RepID=A0AAE0NTE1_9PEZI|nr:hypothetical protein B0H63DRAFT_156685 [Podospora didyma]